MYLVDTTKSHCSKFDNNFAFQKSIDLFSIVDYTYVLQAVHYLNDLLCKQLSENTIFGKLKKKANGRNQPVDFAKQMIR